MPRGAPSVPVHLRLPAELDASVEAFAAAQGVNKSAAIATLIERGLTGAARAVHPAARPRIPTLLDSEPHCVHKDFHKLSFGWKCDDCGALSRDFGISWIDIPTGGGG